MAVKTADLSVRIEALEAQMRSARDAGDEIVNRSLAEARDFTTEEYAAIGEARSKQEAIKKQLAVLTGSLTENTTDERSQPRDSNTNRSRTREDVPPADSAEDRADSEFKTVARKYRAAFHQWARFGIGELDKEHRDLLQRGYRAIDQDNPEQRAMSSQVGASGGYMVPQEFISELDQAMKAYSGVLQAPVRTLNTGGGGDIPYPTVNDTTVRAVIIGENTATSTQDAALGQVTIKGHTLTSKAIIVPNQLLMDAMVNVDSLLSGLLSERMGRGFNYYLTLGNNASQPQGCVPGSVLGKTATSATAISYDDFMDLKHSVDPAYRQLGAGSMFHDQILLALKKLKDSDGRPIWQPQSSAGLGNVFPATLDGDPYFINQDMDSTIAATKKTIVYGAWQKFLVRRIGSPVLVRASERYIENFQTAFFCFDRIDSKIIDAGTNPIKHLLH